MTAWGLAAVVAGASSLLGPRVAFAADVEAIHFHYAAPPECPAEEALLSVASDLGGALRLAASGEPARTLGVVIERTERGFSGSLSVRSVAGDERVRTVTCGRCESAVRALGLIMAMALEDAQPAPSVEEVASPIPEPPTVESVDGAHGPPPDPRDDSGGIAATVLWGSFGWTPTGAGAMAVAPGATRLGGVLAVTTVNVDDPRYQISPTYVLAAGHGASGRLGAVAAWGAPWARDEWAGFMAEGGVRAGVVNGAVWPLTGSGESCSSANGQGSYSCTSGPGSPRTWRFVSPYLAGTVVVQIAPRLSVRPFLAMTLLWSGDYRGNSAASLSLDAGIAWRSW